jgi:hypothetical protein
MPRGSIVGKAILNDDSDGGFNNRPCVLKLFRDRRRKLRVKEDITLFTPMLRIIEVDIEWQKFQSFSDNLPES